MLWRKPCGIRGLATVEEAVAAEAVVALLPLPAARDLARLPATPCLATRKVGEGLLARGGSAGLDVREGPSGLELPGEDRATGDGVDLLDDSATTAPTPASQALFSLCASGSRLSAEEDASWTSAAPSALLLDQLAFLAGLPPSMRSLSLAEEFFALFPRRRPAQEL